MKQCWLVKSEPETYSWNDLVREKRTDWTGVRNFSARNHLRAMKRGDDVLFYHSVSEKAVVGIARVARPAFPDPTAREGDWSAVELAPLAGLKEAVPLDAIKASRKLSGMALLRLARLSVQPVAPEEFREIEKMGGGRVRLRLSPE